MSNQIGNAFTAKYPGIKVNVIKATAQVGFQRLLQAGIRPREKNPGDRYSAAVWAASRSAVSRSGNLPQRHPEQTERLPRTSKKKRGMRVNARVDKALQPGQ